MATTAEIYNWFMTGKKPTQSQFWSSWGSFWNKLEQIPISSIQNLGSILNAKAEKIQLDLHKIDQNAHAELFAKAKIHDAGELIMWRPPGNTEDSLQVGNICFGLLDDGITFIPFGQYLGGDPQNPDSWNTSPMTFEPLEGEGGGGPGGGGGGDPIM